MVLFDEVQNYCNAHAGDAFVCEFDGGGFSSTSITAVN